MNDITTIYHNNFGVAFFWNRGTELQRQRIQLVFRDTGLLLTHRELLHFQEQVARSMTKCPDCSRCPGEGNCRFLLLETPLPQMSYVVSPAELASLDDLVEGTLFHLGLDRFLGQILTNS